MRILVQTCILFLVLAGCQNPPPAGGADLACATPADCAGPDLAMPDLRAPADLACYTPMKCVDQCCDPVCRNMEPHGYCPPNPCTVGYVCDYTDVRCECRNGAWLFINKMAPPDMARLVRD